MLVKKVKLKSLLCHITGQMGLKWIRQTYLVLWTLNALRIIMVSFHKVCLDSIQCDLVVFTKPFCNQYYLVWNKFTAALAVRNFALMKTSLMQMMKIVLSVASVSYAIIGKVQLKIVIWSIFFYVTGHWWSLYDSSILSKPFSSFYDSMKYMSWNNKICPKLLKIRECSWKLSNFFNLKGRTLLKDFSIWKTTIFHNFCSSRKDLKQFLILTKHAVIWVWKPFFLVEGEITKFK